MTETKARDIESALLDTPCQMWSTRQAIVLDWADGPIEGLCALSNPDCEFYFERHSEKRSSDDLDDRLFLISFVKRGSVARTLTALNPLGEPSHPVWIPIWRFDSSGDQAIAEEVVQGVLKSKHPTSLIIRTDDMKIFDDCISASRNIKKFLNWFEYKGHEAESVVGT